MRTSTSVGPAATALDERELAILRALAEHKVLATDQIELLFFDSDRSAQRVLRELRTNGLVDYFEYRTSARTRDPNRHYLTFAGAKLVASIQQCRVASLGALVDPRRAAQFMPHRSGVNRFFCDLVRHALMRSGFGVETWRDEHKLRTPFGEVQPDSFGRLLLPDGAVEFYFEYDNATERRGYLEDKFAGYLRIASRWRSLDGKPFPNVLFVTTKDDREHGLLTALLRATQRWHAQRARSAMFPFYCTTVARLAKRGQLGAVWRDMFVPHQQRLRLDQLPTVDADPYRLEDCLGRRFSKRD